MLTILARFIGMTGDIERMAEMKTLHIEDDCIIDSNGDKIPFGPHWVSAEKARRRHLESNVQTHTTGGSRKLLYWADQRAEREGKR